MKASILISSFNRTKLFRRALWSIANRPPSIPYEVVVCDDGSTEDVLSLLKEFSSRFEWKFIRFDSTAFTQATGIRKFLNNPCATNNLAYKYSTGNLLYHMGNEVIAWDNVFDKLRLDIPQGNIHYMVMSTTYDVQQRYLDMLDEYGSNLTQGIVERCHQFPLQSAHYRSDVTNYISLAPRDTWDALRGYDERYFGGISKDDSDFVRRARKLPGFVQIISDGVSLHQFHHGKTCYYDPPPKVISKSKWEDGVAINSAIYNAWDGTYKNPQPWQIASFGVVEVVTNG